MKNNLQSFRRSQNLTQSQVANLVGIAESSYQRYERGSNLPVVDMALRLARALNTTVEELFVLEDEND